MGPVTVLVKRETLVVVGGGRRWLGGTPRLLCWLTAGLKS